MPRTDATSNEVRANGSVSKRPSPGRSKGVLSPPRTGPLNGEASPSFSLSDLNKRGLRFFLPVATLVLGLGSTGSAVAHQLVRAMLREIGRLPEQFQYMLLDASPLQPDMDSTQFVQIGTAGSGTLADQGLKLFRQYASTIRDNLSRRVEHLFHHVDPEYPLRYTPREETAFWVIGGCGGTSGGTLQPAIATIHDVARDWDIAEPRIQVVQLGPEMATRDRARHLTPEQEKQIQANAAANLLKLAHDMANPAAIEETRPHDGTTFSLQASKRVHTLIVVDKSNGSTQFATTEQMIAMTVEALYARLFTEAGTYIANRSKDHHQTGFAGLPTD
jgi:hypothetical protein